MASLYDSIYILLEENTKISNAELRRIFPKYNKKYLINTASQIRNELGISEYQPPDNIAELGKKAININLIEPIIYDKITKNPTNQDLKLAVEILKLKMADKGMDDDLDIMKYIQKGKDNGLE